MHSDSGKMSLKRKLRSVYPVDNELPVNMQKKTKPAVQGNCSDGNGSDVVGVPVTIDSDESGEAESRIKSCHGEDLCTTAAGVRSSLSKGSQEMLQCSQVEKAKKRKIKQEGNYVTAESEVDSREKKEKKTGVAVEDKPGISAELQTNVMSWNDEGDAFESCGAKQKAKRLKLKGDRKRRQVKVAACKEQTIDARRTKYQLVCQICNKTFANLSTFSEHIKSHGIDACEKGTRSKCTTVFLAGSHETSNNVRPATQQYRSVSSELPDKPKNTLVRCEACDISFETTSNYTIHKERCPSSSKRKVNYYPCPECPQKFSRMLTLHVHEMEHAFEVCKDCHQKMPDEETLQAHVKLECPERYKLFTLMTQSSKCKEVTVNEMKRSINRRNPVIHSCSQASDVFGRVHVANEERNQKLGDENQSTNTQDNISGTVNGTCKASCDVSKKKKAAQGKICKICNRKLRTYQALKLHEMLHKKDQKNQFKTGQYQCPHCLKCYRARRPVIMHRKFFCHQQDWKEDFTMKLQPGNRHRVHVCGICRSKFTNSEHLSLHKMIHFVHAMRKENRGEANSWVRASNDFMQKGPPDNLDVSDRATGDEVGNLAEKKRRKKTTSGTKWAKVCKICRKKFPSVAALKEHQKRVSLTRLKYPHHCPSCTDIAFTHRPLIISECHYLQHQKQFRFKCLFCGVHYKSKKTLKEHITRTHDFQMKQSCPGCHLFLDPREYLQHIEYNTNQIEHLDRKCLSCGKVFNSTDALDLHASKKFRNHCDICCQHFQDLGKLKMHRWKCHRLSTKRKLKNHLGYVCLHCNKLFTKASLLSAHVKSLIENLSDQLLCSWEYQHTTCLHCGMTFTKEIDFQMHRLIWRHICCLCHKHFKSVWGLWNHQQQEHGETAVLNQLLECKYCGHGFNTLKEKRNHESQANAESLLAGRTLPFSCHNCGKRIKTICELGVHACSILHIIESAEISCRFCRLEFARTTGDHSFSSHSKEINEICMCNSKLRNTCQRSAHQRKHVKEYEQKERKHVEDNEDNLGKQNEFEKKVQKQNDRQCTDENCECEQCGEQSKYLHWKTYHPSKEKNLRCSVCNTGLVACEVSKHREHIESKIKGQICAHCREPIPASEYNLHQKLQGKTYTCSCGEKIEASCKKEQHVRHLYVCSKCHRHFDTYHELVGHLVKYNYANLMAGADFTLSDTPTWDMVQIEGETIHTCLHCGEEVTTLAGKLEHDSVFKYKCLPCKKHFRTSFEVEYHFNQEKHDIPAAIKEKLSSFTNTEHCKNKSHNGDKALNKKKQDDDGSSGGILSSFYHLSVCDVIDQNLIEIEFQIGDEVYSILTDNRLKGNVVSLEACSELTGNESSSYVPTPADGSLEAGKSDVEISHERAIAPDQGKQKKQNVCLHCKISFANKASLKRHLSSKENHSKGILYTCLKCDRSFDVVCGLEYHLSLMCRYCGKHFRMAKVREGHEQQCTDKTEYSAIASRSSSGRKVNDSEDVRSASEKLGVQGRPSDYQEESSANDSTSFSEAKANDSEDLRSASEKPDQEAESNEQLCRNESIMMEIDRDRKANRAQGQAEEFQIRMKTEMEDVREVDRNEVNTDIACGTMVQGDDVVRAHNETCTDKEIRERLNLEIGVRVKVEGDNSLVDSHMQKEVLEPGSCTESRREEKEADVKGLRKNPTHPCVVDKIPMEIEEPCELCRETLKIHTKFIDHTYLSYLDIRCGQSNDPLKWMKCVCLFCNLKLQGKCHINNHIVKHPYRCRKKTCRKHFSKKRLEDMHMCRRCTFCTELNFDSVWNLRLHMENWHRKNCREMEVKPSDKITRDKQPTLKTVVNTYEHEKGKNMSPPVSISMSSATVKTTTCSSPSGVSYMSMVTPRGSNPTFARAGAVDTKLSAASVLSSPTPFPGGKQTFSRTVVDTNVCAQENGVKSLAFINKSRPFTNSMKCTSEKLSCMPAVTPRAESFIYIPANLVNTTNRSTPLPSSLIDPRGSGTAKPQAIETTLTSQNNKLVRIDPTSIKQEGNSTSILTSSGMLANVPEASPGNLSAIVPGENVVSHGTANPLVLTQTCIQRPSVTPEMQSPNRQGLEAKVRATLLIHETGMNMGNAGRRAALLIPTSGTAFLVPTSAPGRAKTLIPVSSGAIRPTGSNTAPPVFVLEPMNQNVTVTSVPPSTTTLITSASVQASQQ